MFTVILDHFIRQFFHSFISMVFIILLLLLLLVYFSLFDSLSLKVFQCDSVVPMFVLSYFILFNPFVGAGARCWVVDTAGREGGSILQGWVAGQL